MSGPLAEAWQNFSDAMNLDQAPDEVQARFKGAFFAGAASLEQIHRDVADAEDMDKSLELINACARDIKAFIEEMEEKVSRET